MVWPFENDTTAVETKLADRSLKAGKKRSFFVGSIIFLSAFLLSFITILIVNATVQMKNLSRVDNSGEAMVTILGIVVVLLLTAGAAIKNITCVSVLQRVRDFGQLRTIGMTCRQIAAIVKKERQRLSRPCIAAGTFAGLLGNVLLPLKFYPLQSVLCMFLAGAFVWLICISAFRAPARLAAAVSPLAALRQDSMPGKKNRLSGRITERFRFLSNALLSVGPSAGGAFPRPLTPVQLGYRFFLAEPKKTFYTFASLILSGILMFVVFSVIGAINVETLAKGPYRENSSMFLQLNSTAEEDSTYNLMKNSPFTEKLHQEILSVPGVTDIYELKMLDSVILSGGDKVETSINGIMDEESFEKEMTEGDLPGVIEKTSEEAMTEGTAMPEDHTENLSGWILPVVVNRGSPYYQDIDQLYVGDLFEVQIDRGYQKQTVRARVCGFTENKNTGVILYTSEKNLMQLSEINCNLIWYVCVKPGKETEAAKQVKDLARKDDRVSVSVLEEDITSLHRYFHNTETIIIMVTTLISLFSFLNLLNTCATNALARRHDYALLEAAGMTKRQIRQMWSAETLSYLLGSFLGSCLLGILICGRIARMSGIYYIKYRFPLAFVLLYGAADAFVYFIMIIWQDKDYKRRSVVENISLSQR